MDPPLLTTPLVTETVERVLNGTPYVIGIKDSSGQRDRLGYLAQARGDRSWRLLVGDDAVLVEAMAEGWDGCISGTSGAFPELILAVMRAARDRDESTLDVLVPLLRAGNTLGVLVVQNRTYRVYTEEEVEALQTTAMVVAEMLATGELQALAPVETGIALRRPVYQRGVALADGVGLGHVVLHEPRVVVKNLIAENIEAAWRRTRHKRTMPVTPQDTWWKK